MQLMPDGPFLNYFLSCWHLQLPLAVLVVVCFVSCCWWFFVVVGTAGCGGRHWCWKRTSLIVVVGLIVVGVLVRLGVHYALSI